MRVVFGLVVSLGVIMCDLCFGKGLLSLAWFTFEGNTTMLLCLLRFYPRSEALFAMSIAERRLALRPIDLCKKIRRKAEAITGDSQMTMKFMLMYSYIVLDLLEVLGKK